MTSTMKYAVDPGGIATITIDMPGRTMNVLSREVIADLAECVEKVAADAKVIGAILTSAKAEFVAGADIHSLVEACARGVTVRQGYEWSRHLTQILRRLETCGKPFAAAINGLALGGGFEIALACHFRVLADRPEAMLGLPEVSIGLIPGAGGTQRLPRLIGVEQALPIILQGKKLRPQQALELGVVHEIAPAEQLLERARSWLLKKPSAVAAWDIKGFRMPGGAGASNPKTAQAFMVGTALLAGNTQHNYPAPIAALSAIYEGCITPIDKGLDIESQYFGQLVAGKTALNMMRSLFINKGAADKLVRRPQSVPKSRVTKLGVIGAGMMGAAIAYVSARAGMQVVLLDTDVERAQLGKAYSEGLLRAAIARGNSTEEEAQTLLRLINPTADYAALAGCELVIEAVFENRQIKAEVTAKAEAAIAHSAIFASNTSTLPITGLATASTRPKSFIGLHFFSPVEKMPLVELIVGEESSDEAVARGLDYIQQIRKTPIVVKDGPGFYTSRVFASLTDEAMTMLAEGVSPALIENAAKMAGLPVGPLAVMDEVSIELGYRISLERGKRDADGSTQDSGFAVMKKFVEELDRKGKRFGQGFYDYPRGQKKHLWPSLHEHYPLQAEQPPVQEVIDRMLFRQALETARCYEEGLLNHPADADIGSIFGWGFPAWTGGTLTFIDTLGIEHFVARCDRMTESYGGRFAVSDWLRQRANRGERFHA